jgi:imidazolonepropionase-like amidohydrolase
VLSLPAALAKATILPAKLLERGAPAMRKKGRVQIGADADLTVFDADTIIDRSTIEAPGVESEGVRYVVIGGEVVRDPQGNRRDTRPGIAIQRG